MDRLTKRSRDTVHDNGICCTHFRGLECFKVNGNCSAGCPWEEDVWERLAAYEDTGLEPDEITAMRHTLEEYHRTADPLLSAKASGRVVVFPCKVGDGLWTFCSHPVEQVYSFTVTDISTLNGRTMLNTSRCGVIDARDVGKTVFLTREEAEKALEVARNG